MGLEIELLKKRYNVLVDMIEDVNLRDVLDDLIGDCSVYRGPASRVHHIEEYGLLKHCIEVAEYAYKIAEIAKAPVTRDYLIFCGLLHDYGKVCKVGFSFRGGLQHSFVGAQKVGEAMMRRGCFSQDDVNYITNIIGSHHRGFEPFGDYHVHTCLENYFIYQADGASAITYISISNIGSEKYDCYGEKGLTYTKDVYKEGVCKREF